MVNPQGSCLSCAAIVQVLLAVSVSGLLAQTPAVDKRRADDMRRAEVRSLDAIVNAVAKGKLPGGDAWLHWDAHFLRAKGQDTYVPFTVWIREAPEAFGSILMYVRVVRRGDDTAPTQDLFGDSDTRALGELVHLGIARRRYAFEAFYPVELPSPTQVSPIRRAFTVPPGEYDVYVAMRERATATAMDVTVPKSAVLRQQITVPDYSRSGLRISSVMVADRTSSLTTPVAVAEQAKRPYALGLTEIEPARDMIFQAAETLSTILIVYNARTASRGMPDVTVDYRCFREGVLHEPLFGETAPQRFSAQTLPPGFSLSRARELPVTQSLPLQKFPVGPYRLEITVTDRVSGDVATATVRFTVTE